MIGGRREQTNRARLRRGAQAVSHTERTTASWQPAGTLTIPRVLPKSADFARRCRRRCSRTSSEAGSLPTPTAANHSRSFSAYTSTTDPSHSLLSSPPPSFRTCATQILAASPDPQHLYRTSTHASYRVCHEEVKSPSIISHGHHLSLAINRSTPTHH